MHSETAIRHQAGEPRQCVPPLCTAIPHPSHHPPTTAALMLPHSCFIMTKKNASISPEMVRNENGMVLKTARGIIERCCNYTGPAQPLIGRKGEPPLPPPTPQINKKSEVLGQEPAPCAIFPVKGDFKQPLLHQRQHCK